MIKLEDLTVTHVHPDEIILRHSNGDRFFLYETGTILKDDGIDVRYVIDCDDGRTVRLAAWPFYKGEI
jgi:hypothetical protein